MNPHQLQESSAQSGFTIIESLVAILVVAILMVAIAPVLVISTATRVQARRVELAADAAKAFIDAIKSKTILDPTITVTLTSASTTTKLATATTSSDLQRYLLDTDPPTSSASLYCFNKNGSIANPGCISNQFYIHAIRFAVTGNDPDKGQSYRLGIRVYRSDAEFGSLTASRNGKKAATFTGGLGDRKAPLVEITTEIVRGQPSYSALCDRLGGCQPPSP